MSTSLPVAFNDSASLNEDTTVTIDVLANDNDPEGSPLSVEVTDFPEHGSLTTNADDTMTYTPHPDYFGSDSFRYQISDGNNYSQEEATVSLDIVEVNDPPIAVGDTYSTPESTNSLWRLPMVCSKTIWNWMVIVSRLK